MKAVYTPTKPGMKLNIRKDPDATSEVVGHIEANDPVDVESVIRGWCKLEDGYIDARFVNITTEPTVLENQGDSAADATPPEDATANDGEPTEPTVLENMSRDELLELAEKSGIKVRKNISTEKLLEAILDADDE